MNTQRLGYLRRQSQFMGELKGLNDEWENPVWAENQNLKASSERVRELHHPVPRITRETEDGCIARVEDGGAYAAGYPCPTIQVLEGDNNDQP